MNTSFAENRTSQKSGLSSRGSKSTRNKGHDFHANNKSSGRNSMGIGLRMGRALAISNASQKQGELVETNYSAHSRYQGAHEPDTTFYSWQKSSVNKIDISVFEKVSKKVDILLKHKDEYSEEINADCAFIANYIAALTSIYSLLPLRISKSNEGSISFEFKSKENFYSIEVFNDKEVVFLQDISDKISVENLQLDQIENAFKIMN